jgi:hypothetical protein
MNKTIKGVGKDAPVTTNEHGAKQSALPYRLTLADPNALLQLGKVLMDGAEKYGVSIIGEGWYKISVEDHLDHALNHIFAWKVGDTQEDHLAHAQCRIHMALAVELRRGKADNSLTRISWEQGVIGYWGFLTDGSCKYLAENCSRSLYVLNEGVWEDLSTFPTIDCAKAFAEQLEEEE